jgi:very-short-patch-repair endonuclease/predicted transcriptional regulator of viral defense system
MTADHDLADLAAQSHGVFTLADARSVKLTKRQIRYRVSDRWTTIHDGVYRIAGTPITWRSDLLAATLAAGKGSAISHRSLAALHAMPGGRDDLVELSCLRWKRTIKPNFVVHESRRLDERDLTTIDGIPVTTPERMILDLAWCYPRERYLEYVIQAARRKRLITYDSMRATFNRHARRGLKGVAALRRVLDAWDPASRPSESDMETRLVLTLRDHGLPTPVLQHEIGDSRIDAAYPEANIAIEYDSKQEHSDEFQLTQDARRRNELQANGWVVLSARHADLRRGGDELAAQIRRIMRRAAEPA